MKIIVEKFFLLPFWFRVAILLFLLIVVLWMVFGRAIRWILSVVPYVLNKVFRCLYLLIEIPVTVLHKRMGSDFYKVENKLAGIGEKLDTRLDYWYKEWHSPKKSSFGKTLLVYIICVVFIILPSFLKTDNKILKSGENAYAHCETILIEWFEKREWYNLTEEVVLEQEQQREDNMIENKSFEETLIVSGVSTSLLVRDVPSTENCVILERLYNDDMVTWRGDLVFSEADNAHVESWVKVETANGYEGWCRLFYLHPSDYKDRKYFVNDNK